jgi:hypothetical protein
MSALISAATLTIYLHYVLDEWVATVVEPRLKGRYILVRYADDLVMAFEDHLDAKRVFRVLGRRLERFGLTLHPDKSRFIDFRFRRPGGLCHPATSGSTFDFLGFTHVCADAVPSSDMAVVSAAKVAMRMGRRPNHKTPAWSGRSGNIGAANDERLHRA